MTNRTVLLSIGAAFWIGALGCWLRARGRGRRAWEGVLFIALGLPFLVAGAFYTASSYPEYVPQPAVAPAASPAFKAAPTAPTPVPATPPAPDSAAYRTEVLAAQRAAVARYPELGVAGSPLNRAFVAAYRRLHHTDPRFFDDADWPLHLADETARDFEAMQSR